MTRLSGTVEVFLELKRRGEIEVAEDATFVMVTGDGGMDIGMGSAIGTALRNHNLIMLEYDNEGYMNTGGNVLKRSMRIRFYSLSILTILQLKYKEAGIH